MSDLRKLPPGKEKKRKPDSQSRSQTKPQTKAPRKSQDPRPDFVRPFKKLQQDVKTSLKMRQKIEATKKKEKVEEKKKVELFIGDNRLLRSNPLKAVQEIRSSGHGFSLGSILATVIVVLLVAALIIWTLYKLQIRDHEAIKLEAAKQYYTRSVDLPSRGEIYDRNGFKLASTTYLYRVGITPKHLYSRNRSLTEAEIHAGLAQFLGLNTADVAAAAAQKDASYVQLKKDLAYELGQALEDYVAEHQIGGIRLDPEPKRSYFNGDLASQVIGFTSSEGQVLEGRLGVELSYDDLLSGEEGYTYGARMNYANEGAIPFTRSSSLEKRQGANLYLTLDMQIQRILQDRLAEACRKYAAQEDGMAIAMDPYTGEIYGMASYPYFSSADPTAAPSKFSEEEWAHESFSQLQNFTLPEYPATGTTPPTPEDLKNWELAQRKIHYLSSEVWRNKVISDVYEAGSTFKAITAAIGLEENVTNEQTTYNDAKIQVLDYFISCYSGEEGHGYVSMENGFAMSCNPVFVQIALAAGIETYYDYVEAFGFREPTGVNLPGEANCIFHDQPSLIDLATLSFGEQSPVTPMHMMRAYAALVNGGKLITPTIVKEVRSQDGRLLSEAAVKVEREVISEQTSARIRELMRKMVEVSANYTNSGGYVVGGKTSTSVDEATGYTTISFMQAAPIAHPRLLVMFIIQKPENPAIGGVEAQITTMEATSEILEYLNIDRDLETVAQSQAVVPTKMPGLIGMTFEQASELLKWRRLPIRMGSEKMSKDSLIAAQQPPEGATVFPGNAIYAYAEAFPELEMVRMPDFSGKNAFECINEANRVGLIVNFEGDIAGSCIAQRATYILPEDPQTVEHIVEVVGDELPKGTIVRLAMSKEGSER